MRDMEPKRNMSMSRIEKEARAQKSELDFHSVITTSLFPDVPEAVREMMNLYQTGADANYDLIVTLLQAVKQQKEIIKGYEKLLRGRDERGL